MTYTTDLNIIIDELKQYTQDNSTASFSITFLKRKKLWSVYLLNHVVSFESNDLPAAIHSALIYLKDQKKGDN